MARVVGAFDIGPKRVRLAALEFSGKQISVCKLADEAVAADEGPAYAVARLIRVLDRPLDWVTGCFSQQNASLRSLTLPFTDRKRIEQVLPFELEGLFPFDPEDAVFNYYRLPTRRERESDLLVAAARKELVGSRLQLYRDCQLEPRNLFLDAFTLEQVWRACGGQSPAPVEVGFGESGAEIVRAFLHIGTDDALLLVSHPDGYRFARSLRTGIAALVRRLAVTVQREPAEIEAALAASTLESEERQHLLRPLLREVEQTFLSLEKTVKVRPSRLIVSGLTTHWPCAVDTLGTALGLAAEVMPPLNGIDLGDFVPLVGCAIQSVQGGGLDLRTGDYAFTRAIELVRGKLMFTGTLALILVLLIVGGNAIAYLTKARENARLKDEIETLFQEAFPNEPMVDPAQQMQAELRKLRRQAEQGPGITVVDTLKSISQAVSPEMSFQIIEFHKDATGYRIKAETNSYENVETIKDAIAKLPGMRKVDVPTSQTKATGGIVFELAIGGEGSMP